MRARWDDLAVSYDGEKRLTISTKEDVGPLFDELRDKDIDIEIKVYREKRNLSQNSLYWLYLTRLAQTLKVSNAYMHNTMIRAYGQPERFGDQVVYTLIPDTEEAANKALEAETYHIKPTSKTKEGTDGVTYRAYMLMRGSSTYNTEEFSRLLEGLFSACNDVGIHVMTDKYE